MAEHPNAVIARQMADALSRGDLQALDGFLANDVVWHEIGRAEPRRGKAALLGADAEMDGCEVDVFGPNPVGVGVPWRGVIYHHKSQIALDSEGQQE